MKNTHTKALVPAWFQATVFISSLICLSILLTIRYHTFINLDPVYPLEKNESTIAPSVTVGLHIIQFTKFYVLQNMFELSGTLWFAYNPNIVSLETIKKFSLHNGEIIKISEPVISKTPKETVARFRIRAKFHSQLYYLLFPFDDHCINLVITNDFLPKNVIFTSADNTITMDPSLKIPGWNIVNKTAQAGYSNFLLATPEELSEKYVTQKVVFSFFTENNNPMLAINIVLILLLLLFITLLTFSSDQDCVLIVTVGMVALIGYRFVMQSFEPSNITYFTVADYMYLFALIGAIATLFGGIVTRERESLMRTKYVIIFAIYLFFVSSCILVSFML